jgi:hypothetical protein
VPGLAFVASSAGQYDRQTIRTVGNNYSWIGASGPVSYSVDVAKIGENNPSGFQLFMHLVPGTPAADRADSDWHEPNVVMWSINNNADGSAWSNLRFKTNAPDNNGTMYTDVPAGGTFTNGVGNPTVAGTWTLTFNQDTTVVITAPGGGTATNIIPPEVIATFSSYSPNMQINIGGNPNSLDRLGQMAVVTRARITGTPGEPNLDSNFLGVPPDTNIWTTIAANTNAVRSIPLNAAYWVNWTLPANGYNLQTAATLNGPWSDSTVKGYEVGGAHYNLFLKSDLPGINTGYFRLIQRVFSQLQVLLPGESPAPNTPTGKTGTPTDVSLGTVGYADVTVRAVDANWNLVNSTDTVHLTTTDAFAYVPPDAAMVGGVATFTGAFSLAFGQTGTFTISATNMSRAMPEATSSPINVVP